MDNRSEVREFLSSAAPSSHPRTSDSPTSGSGGSPVCAGARSRRWPGSASSTTPSSNAAPSAGSAPRSSTPSPAPCASTTPNAATCSTSPRPPTEPARSSAPVAAAGAGLLAPAYLGAGLHHRRSGAGPQRPHGPAGHQPARPRHARLALRTLPGPVPNFARYTFLDEDSRRFYPDWDTAADTAVAILRTEAGRDPHDRLMHDLVGELATRSEEFRRRWSSHDVRLHGAGTKSSTTRPSASSSSPTRASTWSPTPDSPSPSTPPNPVAERQRRLPCSDH